MIPNIQTVVQQREWTPLEVTVKATGEKITIKDYRFDPELHKDAKVVGEPRKTPVVKEVEKEDFIIGADERWGYLKNKGWKNLEKQEREDYKKLKAQFEPGK